MEGLKSASLDPFYVEEWFEKLPKALIGIHCGLSGISVLDIDYKEDEDGNVVVDGFDAIEKEWLDIPATYSYSSLSGKGQHLFYLAPEGSNLPPKAAYRKMKGVDRRSGESYVVFQGSELPKKSDLAEAPEWFNDTTTVRTEANFDGSVKDWYESLESGEASSQVRRAMERAQNRFDSQGKDLSHSDIIELQYEAIRLGAERHGGVQELLAMIEDLATSREGDHSRNPDNWAYEFQEGLVSGIAKAGDTIDLAKNLPPFTIELIPADAPARLFSETPLEASDIRSLITVLQRSEADDLTLLSVLWNAASTREVVRDWGMEFTYGVLTKNRATPAPVTENPALVEAQAPSSQTFLTQEEQEIVNAHPTFIDDYLAAAHQARGFSNPAYDIPAAWTLLNLVYGTRAFIPQSKKLELNLWFTMLGESGTGKSTALEFYHHIANAYTSGQETRYQISANSSPDGVEVSLLERDNLPSVIYADEASGWLKNIAKKDWMASLTDRLSEWYDGGVYGSNNLARKEYRGKSAHTSLGMLMAATPDLFTKLLMSEMFEQGFYARVNWTWADPAPEEDESRYYMDFVDFSEEVQIPDSALSVIGHMVSLREALPDHVVRMGVGEGVQARLAKAGKMMADIAAEYDEKNSGVTSPSARRTGPQTAWKCAALLALSDGRDTIQMHDALTALTYVESWFWTLFRVVEAAGNGEFNRDVDEIEKYVASLPSGVNRRTLLHRFRNKIVRSPRELDDRVDFLVSSGRINTQTKDGVTKYIINGTKQKENDLGYAD